MRRVVNTRSSGRNQKLSGLLRAAGFDVVECPLIEIVPLQLGQAEQNLLQDYSKNGVLIFTSSNAVDCAHQAGATGLAACVGEETAGVATGLGFEVIFNSDGKGGGLGFIDEFVEYLKLNSQVSRKILIVRGQKVAVDVKSSLKKKQINADEVIVYNSVTPKYEPGELSEKLSGTPSEVGFVFTSPQAARNGVELFSRDGVDIRGYPVVGIGTTTAGVLRELGFRMVSRAESPSDEGLVEALVRLRTK